MEPGSDAILLLQLSTNPEDQKPGFPTAFFIYPVVLLKLFSQYRFTTAGNPKTAAQMKVIQP